MNEIVDKNKQALRRQAEDLAGEKITRSPVNLAAMSPEDLRQMLHELQVHQIELEMQNEELRRTQLQLDSVRERYFDLYDLAPVGYCTVSEPGLILEANLTAATLLGVTRSELVGKRISLFISKTYQDTFYLYRKQLFVTGEAQTCDLQMLKSDATPLWVNLVTISTQEVDGTAVQRIVISDITERKRLDALLQAKNIELESARSVAEKANRAKSDFLSSMSHELRTPLSAILGFAQLIESGSTPLTQSQKQSVDQILQAGWYLLDLINEILDLALIESGKLSLSLEPISLLRVMQECENMTASQGIKHGITVTFPPTDISYFVNADRIRLKQIFINLLSNAIKYNREGGSVDVYYTVNSPGRIRICVKDSGAGLSPEKIAQLFQLFNRLGQELTVVDGTGIGLVVCKRLVEMMGGVIGVESVVGEGSVFWVELSLTADSERHADSYDTAVVAPIQQLEAHTQLSTLLYVEDNLANLMLVENIIARRSDIRLLTARDGSRGIDIAHASLPDVILMDINLPGLSGIQTLKILRDDPVTAHIPVLALSANAMPYDIEQGLQAGFFRYVTKPIKVNEFMDTLDMAFNFAKNQSLPPV